MVGLPVEKKPAIVQVSWPQLKIEGGRPRHGNELSAALFANQSPLELATPVPVRRRFRLHSFWFLDADVGPIHERVGRDVVELSVFFRPIFFMDFKVGEAGVQASVEELASAHFVVFAFVGLDRVKKRSSSARSPTDCS
jgi:hypothetical protein